MKQDKIACALLMNDIHVGKDTIEEFKANWDEALKVCQENKIDTLFIGGDLFQSRASQTLDVLLAVKLALLKSASLNIFVTIAEGNHDIVNQESLYGYCSIYNSYDKVRVVEDFITHRFRNGFALHLISYFPENGSFCDKLEAVINSMYEDDINILYIHEGIQGALGGMKLDTEVPQEVFEPFDKVLVGHYHNRCKIKGTSIEYIGASRQHNFGEDEEKGYTILFDDGSTNFIKNEVNTRFKNIEVKAKSISDSFIKELSNIKSDSRYKLKVKVLCDTTEVDTINKQKLLDAGVTKVEIKTDDIDIVEQESHSLDKKFDKSGIKEEYKDFCNSKAIKDVNFGLTYLDKIN